jgi:hypothetical protein
MMHWIAYTVLAATVVFFVGLRIRPLQVAAMMDGLFCVLAAIGALSVALFFAVIMLVVAAGLANALKDWRYRPPGDIGHD